MKNKKTILLAVILSSCFIGIGCQAGIENKASSAFDSLSTVITVTVQEPFNSLTAIQNRSAVPSLPEQASITYDITAICGEKTVTQNQPLAGEINSYRLEIESGEWQINVTGKNLLDSAKEILYGQKTITVDEYGNYNVIIPVYFIEEDEGNVQLEIDVSDSLIDKLLISGTNIALDGEYFKDSEGIISITKNGIAAATYSTVLNFYENIGDEQNPEYALVISLQEKINVRKNMTTDNWKKSGDTIYLIEETTETGNRTTSFKLTTDIITTLVNSSFYVSTENESLRKLNFSEVIPSDSNTGSWADPFLTLQAAINKIFAIKNNSNEAIPYTVYVDGPVEGSGSICYSANDSSNNPVVITIKPYINPANETTGKIIGNTPAGTQDSPILTIGNNSSVCFSDIPLSGLNINVENTGKLIFAGNTSLQDKTILLKNNSKLYLEDISVNQNNQNSIIAKVKSDQPEENKVIVLSNNEAELSEGIINRLRLQNPGYYLAYDSATKKGIIKGSRLSIRLPRIGQCIAEITALSENNTLISSNNGGFTISPDYFEDNEEIVFKAEIETPEFDSNDNRIHISPSQIEMKLYIGAIPVPEELIHNEAGTITLEQNSLLPGKYLLTAGYEYDGLSYEAKTFIELE